MDHGFGGGVANQHMPGYSNSAELDSRQKIAVQEIRSKGRGQGYMCELPAEDVLGRHNR
jgi:hypothetical protein